MEDSPANTPGDRRVVEDKPHFRRLANKSEDPTILEDDILNEQEGAKVMHEAFSSLLEAEDLLSQILDVSGTFFIEVMARECIIILSVLM